MVAQPDAVLRCMFHACTVKHLFIVTCNWHDITTQALQAQEPKQMLHCTSWCAHVRELKQACSCLQVSFVAEQHRTMIEAVENHMPETVIVVCAISTAAFSIQRIRPYRPLCAGTALCSSAWTGISQPSALAKAPSYNHPR